MPRAPRSGETTQVSRGSRAAGTDGGRYLLVLGDDAMITRPLPARGEVLIGRDADCDVPLAHEKISRRHARLHLGDDVVGEDLGSTNGVRLAGRKRDRGER